MNVFDPCLGNGRNEICLTHRYLEELCIDMYRNKNDQDSQHGCDLLSRCSLEGIFFQALC